MRVTGFISILTAAVLTASCMAMQYEPTMDNVAPNPAIVGNVTDTSGVAIEHIKVTLDWNDGAFSETQYTNSDGVFTAEIWENVEKAVRSLTVTLEDIDGEENGGDFETEEVEVELTQTDPGDGDWDCGEYSADDVVVVLDRKQPLE